VNILLDNTVLSNLAVVHRPDLLRVAFDNLLATSEEVFAELNAGVSRGKLPALDWSWLPVWTMDEAERIHYERFLQTLNAGEASCLAMALVRGCQFLTDDRDARELAGLLQIPISGTLGVLIRLVDIDALELGEAESLLTAMIAAGYRSPTNSLVDVL
jgi:predicted nucleic acid-binding protein